MRRGKAYDLMAASPTILLCSFAVVGFGIQIQALLSSGIDLRSALSICVKVLSAAFAALQAVLLLVRRLPIAKSDGWTPRVVAVLGANTALALFALPLQTASEARDVISSAVIITGLTGCVVALSALGRAFSILPQARQLVTSGPYHIVRHPLYLAEQVASAGIMLQYRQPWSFIIFIAGFSLQLARIKFEEQTLAKQFPQYRDYARHTPKLFPGVY